MKNPRTVSPGYNEAATLELDNIVQQEAEKSELQPSRRETIIALIAKNADVNHFSKPSKKRFQTVLNYPSTLLCKAAAGKNTELVELLANTDGIEINKPDIYNQTPLHIAVIQGNTEAVRILLAKKANPNLKCDFNRTALDCLKDCNAQGTIEAILAIKHDIRTLLKGLDATEKQQAKPGRTRLEKRLFLLESRPTQGSLTTDGRHLDAEFANIITDAAADLSSSPETFIPAVPQLPAPSPDTHPAKPTSRANRKPVPAPKPPAGFNEEIAQGLGIDQHALARALTNLQKGNPSSSR